MTMEHYNNDNITSRSRSKKESQDGKKNVVNRYLSAISGRSETIESLIPTTTTGIDENIMRQHAPILQALHTTHADNLQKDEIAVVRPNQSPYSITSKYSKEEDVVSALLPRPSYLRVMPNNTIRTSSNTHTQLNEDRISSDTTTNNSSRMTKSNIWKGTSKCKDGLSGNASVRSNTLTYDTNESSNRNTEEKTEHSIGIKRGIMRLPPQTNTNSTLPQVQQLPPPSTTFDYYKHKKNNGINRTHYPEASPRSVVSNNLAIPKDAHEKNSVPTPTFFRKTNPKSPGLRIQLHENVEPSSNPNPNPKQKARTSSFQKYNYEIAPTEVTTNKTSFDFKHNLYKFQQRQQQQLYKEIPAPYHTSSSTATHTHMIHPNDSMNETVSTLSYTVATVLEEPQRYVTTTGTDKTNIAPDLPSKEASWNNNHNNHHKNQSIQPQSYQSQESNKELPITKAPMDTNHSVTSSKKKKPVTSHNNTNKLRNRIQMFESSKQTTTSASSLDALPTLNKKNHKSWLPKRMNAAMCNTTEMDTTLLKQNVVLPNASHDSNSYKTSSNPTKSKPYPVKNKMMLCSPSPHKPNIVNRGKNPVLVTSPPSIYNIARQSGCSFLQWKQQKRQQHTNETRNQDHSQSQPQPSQPQPQPLSSPFGVHKRASPSSSNNSWKSSTNPIHCHSYSSNVASNDIRNVSSRNTFCDDDDDSSGSSDCGSGSGSGGSGSNGTEEDETERNTTINPRSILSCWNHTNTKKPQVSYTNKSRIHTAPKKQQIKSSPLFHHNKLTSNSNITLPTSTSIDSHATSTIPEETAIQHTNSGSMLKKEPSSSMKQVQLKTQFFSNHLSYWKQKSQSSGTTSKAQSARRVPIDTTPYAQPLAEVDGDTPIQTKDIRVVVPTSSPIKPHWKEEEEEDFHRFPIQSQNIPTQPKPPFKGVISSPDSIPTTTSTATQPTNKSIRIEEDTTTTTTTTNTTTNSIQASWKNRTPSIPMHPTASQQKPSPMKIYVPKKPTILNSKENRNKPIPIENTPQPQPQPQHHLNASKEEEHRSQNSTIPHSKSPTKTPNQSVDTNTTTIRMLQQRIQQKLHHPHTTTSIPTTSMRIQDVSDPLHAAASRKQSKILLMQQQIQQKLNTHPGRTSILPQSQSQSQPNASSNHSFLSPCMHKESNHKSFEIEHTSNSNATYSNTMEARNQSTNPDFSSSSSNLKRRNPLVETMSSPQAHHNKQQEINGVENHHWDTTTDRMSHLQEGEEEEEPPPLDIRNQSAHAAQETQKHSNTKRSISPTPFSNIPTSHSFESYQNHNHPTPTNTKTTTHTNNNHNPILSLFETQTSFGPTIVTNTNSFPPATYSVTTASSTRKEKKNSNNPACTSSTNSFLRELQNRVFAKEPPPQYEYEDDYEDDEEDVKYHSDSSAFCIEIKQKARNIRSSNGLKQPNPSTAQTNRTTEEEDDSFPIITTTTTEEREQNKEGEEEEEDDDVLHHLNHWHKDHDALIQPLSLHPHSDLSKQRMNPLNSNADPLPPPQLPPLPHKDRLHSQSQLQTIHDPHTLNYSSDIIRTEELTHFSLVENQDQSDISILTTPTCLEFSSDNKTTTSTNSTSTPEDYTSCSTSVSSYLSAQQHHHHNSLEKQLPNYYSYKKKLLVSGGSESVQPLVPCAEQPAADVDVVSTSTSTKSSLFHGFPSFYDTTHPTVTKKASPIVVCEDGMGWEDVQHKHLFHNSAKEQLQPHVVVSDWNNGATEKFTHPPTRIDSHTTNKATSHIVSPSINTPSTTTTPHKKQTIPQKSSSHHITQNYLKRTTNTTGDTTTFNKIIRSTKDTPTKDLNQTNASRRFIKRNLALQRKEHTVPSLQTHTPLSKRLTRMKDSFSTNLSGDGRVTQLHPQDAVTNTALNTINPILAKKNSTTTTATTNPKKDFFIIRSTSPSKEDTTPVQHASSLEQDRNYPQRIRNYTTATTTSASASTSIQYRNYKETTTTSNIIHPKKKQFLRTTTAKSYLKNDAGSVATNIGGSTKSTKYGGTSFDHCLELE